MCIICIKPANVPMPDFTLIHKMWTRNPHGAGFMLADGKTVRIEKGFMEEAEFVQYLDVEANDRGSLTPYTVVMHFRISTHGGITPGNTHPFPLSKSIKRMHAIAETTSLGIAHNGIIPITPQEKGISDTMEFIRSALVPLSQTVPDWDQNKSVLNLIERSIGGSRMVFLRPDGSFTKVGDWTVRDGLIFSNNHIFDLPKPRFNLTNYPWKD